MGEVGGVHCESIGCVVFRLGLVLGISSTCWDLKL